MLPLSLFRERNFTIGNLATLTAYLGLGGVIFLLPVFLQEVSGYSPVQAGLALLPVTSLMILLSRRFGALADRIGSRVLISLGALVAAARPFALGACRSARRLRQRGPAGAARVRVGTRDACRAVDGHRPWGSGGGSRRRRRRGEYDALTRRTAFRGRRAGGRRLSSFCQSRRRDATTDRARFGGRAAISRAKRQPLGSPSLVGAPPGERVLLRATFEDASVHAFRVADTIAAVLVASGGLIALAGIRNPRRRVAAELCPAGALCGASQELVHTRQLEARTGGLSAAPSKSHHRRWPRERSSAATCIAPSPLAL